MWLKQQKIAQLYAKTRKGRATDTFKPTKPWYQMSMDLIDFTNKPGRSGMRYNLESCTNKAMASNSIPIRQSTGSSSPRIKATHKRNEHSLE